MDPVPRSGIASGRPYRVISVDGRPPGRMDDFLDQPTFTVEHAGAALDVCGVGSKDGDQVVIHEKGGTAAGKDVRIWRVTVAPGGTFLATPSAAF